MIFIFERGNELENIYKKFSALRDVRRIDLRSFTDFHPGGTGAYQFGNLCGDAERRTAGFSAGVGCIVGPTGGYLLGYLVLAAVEGLLYRQLSSEKQKLLKKSGVLIVSMVVGTAALYTMGTIWFITVTHTPLAAALLACVVPFLLGDAVKIAVVTVLAPQLERVLNRLNHRAQAV